MAYDEFENTSYDLNRDGHIDSAEASYIHETLYGDDKHGDHLWKITTLLNDGHICAPCICARATH